MNALDEALARIAELEAEVRESSATTTSLLSLLYDLRVALGDNGKLMQDELVEHAKALRAERDALKVDAERYRYWRSASMDERNRLEHYAESALDIVIDAAMKDQPKEPGQ